MGMPNCTDESFVNFLSMRIFGPFWSDGNLKTPDSKTAGERYARNNGKYEATTDFTRAFGRGIATVRATHFAQHGLWVVNGVEDKEDLRHNSKVGNWVNMEDLTYNNKDSKYYGQNFMLYSPEDVWGVDKDGKPVITTHKGALLCNDTIVIGLISLTTRSIWRMCAMKLIWVPMTFKVQPVPVLMQTGICIVWLKLICCVLKLSIIKVRMLHQM